MPPPAVQDAGERFAGLLLAFRGRTGLTQRSLAAQTGVSPRSVQGWEAGINLPTAERLRAVIEALLHSGGLIAGHERNEAESLWAAALRESSRMHTPFDAPW